jgi:hypothetical protein
MAFSSLFGRVRQGNFTSGLPPAEGSLMDQIVPACNDIANMHISLAEEPSPYRVWRDSPWRCQRAARTVTTKRAQPGRFSGDGACAVWLDMRS